MAILFLAEERPMLPAPHGLAASGQSMFFVGEGGLRELRMGKSPSNMPSALDPTLVLACASY